MVYKNFVEIFTIYSDGNGVKDVVSFAVFIGHDDRDSEGWTSNIKMVAMDTRI